MASKMDFRRKFQNKHKKSEDENETSDSAGNSVMLFPEIMAASELMGVLREVRGFLTPSFVEETT